MTTLHRLLLADDDGMQRNLLDFIFKKSGKYEYKICSSGEELLDTVEDFKPDLILLDQTMPGLSGVETYKLLREKYTEDVPVFFMSANEKEEHVFMEVGAKAYIRKPVKPGELCDEIEKHWTALD